MLTVQPLLPKQQAGKRPVFIPVPSDRVAFAFIALGLSYLLLGLTFGVLGSFQYVLPQFLRDHLAFQKIRPLHVYRLQKRKGQAKGATIATMLIHFLQRFQATPTICNEVEKLTGREPRKLLSFIEANKAMWQ